MKRHRHSWEPRSDIGRARYVCECGTEAQRDYKTARFVVLERREEHAYETVSGALNDWHHALCGKSGRDEYPGPNDICYGRCIGDPEDRFVDNYS